jgi:hypothetical protein
MFQDDWDLLASGEWGVVWSPLWSSGQSSWPHKGDVLCFLWGTNWIYICYVEESRPPLWSSRQRSWLHNGDVLCFLWSTNWIYICYVEESRPPIWSSGESSCLQIQSSRLYQIFGEVVGLERGLLSLVSTIEELLGSKSSGSGLESIEYGRGDPLSSPRDTLYPQTFSPTSTTSGSRSVCIVPRWLRPRSFFSCCNIPWQWPLPLFKEKMKGGMGWKHERRKWTAPYQFPGLKHGLRSQACREFLTDLPVAPRERYQRQGTCCSTCVDCSLLHIWLPGFAETSHSALSLSLQ